MRAENLFEVGAEAERVADSVGRDGFAIVRGALGGETLETVRADLRPHLERAHAGHEPFMGTKTRRFGALLAKCDSVQRLVLDPTVLAVADNVLLPHCYRYRLHYTGVMHLEPGEDRQVLHRDTSIYPFANPCPPLTVATMWAISDFSRDNGATRIVPGSHRWNDARRPHRSEVVAAEMPAGSVLIYTGNVIHGGGANRSNRARTGVALHYNLGWLRQEENQFMAASPECARRLPARIRELMGYALGGSHLGFVDHVAPGDYLDGVRDPARSDLSPPGMSESMDALQRFHISAESRVPARFFEVDTD